jgi:hypothetical protein
MEFSARFLILPLKRHLVHKKSSSPDKSRSVLFDTLAIIGPGVKQFFGRLDL